MKLRTIGKLFLLSLLSIAIPSCGGGKDNKVGLLQIADHPALDKTRSGIESTLKEAGIKVDFESAQGNPTTAVQIAAKFQEKKYPAIVTIGTLATQSALKNSDSPIIFSSVTSPTSLGEINEGAINTGDGKVVKITGVSNFIAIEPQLSFYKKLLPNVQHIGMIYNAGEMNAVRVVDAIQSVAAQFDLKFTAISVSSTSDIPAAVTSLISNKVGAIWINNDNTALSAIQTIVKMSQEAKIPVLCSDIDTIGTGVTAAVGPDQFKIGVETAKIVIEILRNKKDTKDIAIESPKEIIIKIDEKAAAENGLSISKELLDMNNSSLGI